MECATLAPSQAIMCTGVSSPQIDGRRSWPHGASSRQRTRSLSLMTRAINRCRNTESPRRCDGGQLLSARQISWLPQCDSVADLLVSLNDGNALYVEASDAGGEYEDEPPWNQKHVKWLRQMSKLTQCWDPAGGGSDDSDAEENNASGRPRKRRSWRPGAWPMFKHCQPDEVVLSDDGEACSSASPSSTPRGNCSELSGTEWEGESPPRRHTSSSLEVFEALVDAMKPWAPRSRKSTEEDDSTLSPPGSTKAAERKGAARRIMEQVRQETLDVASAASELMEQVTQDTRIASGALRRKATSEMLKFTAMPRSDDPFWLAPSSHANYVMIDTEVCDENIAQVLNPKAVAKLAKLASQDALKASKTAASDLMEQVSQDTRQVAHAASEFMEHASTASDALRRKATSEVLKLTTMPKRFEEDAFWLAPSSPSNYVHIYVETGEEIHEQGLHPKAVAKLAKLASQDALKASKKGLKASKKKCSKLWREAPGRHEVERMSRKWWQDAPDLARLWQDAPDAWTTMIAGLTSRQQPDMDEDTADCVTTPPIPDADAWVASSTALEVCSPSCGAVPPEHESDHASLGGALQCHMMFASPLCLERLVVVQLALSRPYSDIIPEEEMASWGVFFERMRPNHVLKVFPDGLVSAWNAKRDHPEGMVAPGDVFVHMSLAGVGVWAQGRPISIVFKEVLQTLRTQLPTGGVCEMRLELVFNALRALPPLRIHDEIAALRASGCEVVTQAATVQNIRAFVASAGCRILHMSLHCASAQQQLLFLEDGSGKAHVVRSSELHNLLGRGQQQQHIHVAFLNACHSLSIGVNLVAAGVRHVVCVHDDNEVRDESCCRFARDFFAALRAGRSVREAFDCGVAILICSEEAHFRRDAHAFVLLPQGNSHDEVYFPGGAPPCPTSSASVEGGSWGAVLPSVEDFLGREVDIHHLLRQLHMRRFLVLCGAPGMGKTALLAELGRYVRLRGEPFEEVRWVDGQDDHLRAASCDGIVELLERLSQAPTRRVLLLVDNPAAFTWAPFRALLRFEAVHLVVSVALLEEGQDRDDGLLAASAIAMAAGLKPVQYPLGPLMQVAQAKLFLKRASRPLYASELGGAEREETPIAQQLSHAELLELAETPRLRALGGNPRRIVAAAQALPLDQPAATDSLPESASAPGSMAGTPRGLRRVRLVRPDGKSRDEWLRGDVRIAEVLAQYTPKTMVGAAEIAVLGCRAHPDSLLADFPDDAGVGFPVLEIRSSLDMDW